MKSSGSSTQTRSEGQNPKCEEIEIGFANPDLTWVNFRSDKTYVSDDTILQPHKRSPQATSKFNAAITLRKLKVRYRLWEATDSGAGSESSVIGCYNIIVGTGHADSLETLRKMRFHPMKISCRWATIIWCRSLFFSYYGGVKVCVLSIYIVIWRDDQIFWMHRCSVLTSKISCQMAHRSPSSCDCFIFSSC